MKHTKKALLLSVLSLLLCCSMLVGSTFAWFTDSVTSGNNKIVAGNLDVELYHTSASVDTEEEVSSDTKLFLNADGKDILWEPGVIAYENFTVKNVGSLALKYSLAIKDLVKNYVVEHDAATSGETTTEKSLTDVIQVAVTTEDVTRASVETMTFTNLEDFAAPTGTLMPKGGSDAEESFNVVLYWKPSAADDQYNLKNGLTASNFNGSPADALMIEFGVELTASQYTYESDTFGPDYDSSATDGNGNIIVLTSESKPVAENKAFSFTMPGNTATGKGELTVSFPADSLDDAEAHTVELIAETQKPYEGEESDPTKQAIANVELTLLVDDEEVHDFNGKTVTITTYVPTDLLNVEVVYKGAAKDEVLEGTTYDKNTGKLTFQTNHFSLFEIRADRLMTEEEEKKVAEGMKYHLGDNFYPDMETFAPITDSYYKEAIAQMTEGQTLKFLTDTEVDRRIVIGRNVENVTVDLGGNNITFLRKNGDTGDALGFQVYKYGNTFGTVTFQNGTINAWNTGSTYPAIYSYNGGAFKLKNLTVNNIGNTSTSSKDYWAVVCGSDSHEKESYIDDCVINGYVMCGSQSTLHIANTVINGNLQGQTNGHIYLDNVTVNGDVKNGGFYSDAIIIKSGHFKSLPEPRYYSLAEGSKVSFNEATGMYDVIAE